MVLKNNKLLPSSSLGHEGEDKISRLPVELIHDILSFLPIQSAMSTCILSKKWKYLPKSMPILDFRTWRARKDTRAERELERKLFKDFLDTILLHHEKPYIRKFYLHLDDKFDESQVYRWITNIIEGKVEELGLSITTSVFPPSFFTCDSLTVLDLSFENGGVTEFTIPNEVFFPKLKILWLTYIHIEDETSATEMFSNCPILEELRLSDCNIDRLCIGNTGLKHLSITFCVTESLVEISAPNLLTFRFQGYSPKEFVLDSFPSLIEADVDFYVDDAFNLNEVSFKLFQKLSSAKHLKISEDSFRVLRKVDIFFTGLLTFNNMIRLEISSQFDYTDSDSDSISTRRAFFRLLQLSRNLETIVFGEGVELPDVDDDDCWSLDPKCSLPHLKSIKFEDFRGQPMELNAIELLLKYAGKLETVTIVAHRLLSENEKKQLNINKLLLKYPKHASCVVDVL